VTRFPPALSGSVRPGVGDEDVMHETSRSTVKGPRKAAERALRESEERFARFMQHLPGLAWIKDLQGRYVFANDAALKAFRAPRERLYGRTDEEVFPPEVAAQFVENDRRALAAATGVQFVELLEHEDGVLHHSIVSKFPIPGPDDEPKWVGGTARRHRA